MAGERYGYSIDIGKELEKEEEQKEASKKSESKKESSKDEETTSEKELAIEEQDIKEKIIETPKPAESKVPKEEPVKDEVSEKELAIEEQDIKEKILETPSPTEEKPEEIEEPESDQIPYKAPDPIEDDINEIITRHGPLNNDRKSFFRKMITSPVLILLLGIIIFGGWFLTKDSAEEVVQTAIIPSIEPIPLPIEHFPLPIEQVKLEAPNKSINTIEGLPDFFADKLRD